MSWQREKYEKTVKEKELELRENYDEVYGKKLEESFKKGNPDADSKKRERTTGDI